MTIDMGFEQFKTEFEQAKRDFCLPASFCKLDKKKGCVYNENGDFAEICEDSGDIKGSDICSRWAGKDVDWPNVRDDGTDGTGGAYAFGVRFPANFVADDQDHRPPPTCLRASDRGWNVPLVRAADKKLLGDCAETPVPAPGFCP